MCTEKKAAKLIYKMNLIMNLTEKKHKKAAKLIYKMNLIKLDCTEKHAAVLCFLCITDTFLKCCSLLIEVSHR